MQGLIDGVLTDKQHAEYQARLEAINPDNTYNFCLPLNTCQEIEKNYRAARAEVLLHQRDVWQGLWTQVCKYLCLLYTSRCV